MDAVRKCAAACVLQSCALGVTLFLGSVPSASAAESAACKPSAQASLDARMAAKADQGPQQLNRFVQRTRTVFQLDYATAVARVERFRQERARCEALRADAS